MGINLIQKPLIKPALLHYKQVHSGGAGFPMKSSILFPLYHPAFLPAKHKQSFEITGLMRLAQHVNLLSGITGSGELNTYFPDWQGNFYSKKLKRLSMKLSGELLRLTRNIKGLKQQTVAKQLGVSQAAYSKMEKSKSLDANKFLIIIKAMGCNEEDFAIAKSLYEKRQAFS